MRRACRGRDRFGSVLRCETRIQPCERGSGIFLHNDPADRPADVFAGVNTIHAGGDRASHLLIPLLPPDQAESNATVSVS